jgi:hypothetical protein
VRGKRIKRGTHVCVVIFRQDVEIALVDSWLDAVELADVGVLDPIYQHFDAKNQKKGREHFAGPAGKNSETVRKNGIASDGRLEVCCAPIRGKHAEPSNFDDIS